MSRATPSLARAEMLKWARQACYMSVEAAAGKLQLPASRLESWETGEEAPSIPQLRRLGEIYKRPLAYFYLPRPPGEPEMLVEYRSKAKSVGMTPELYNELRVGHARRNLAIELAEELQETLQKFSSSASIDEDPEIVGQRLRKDLGVSLDQQVSSENREENRSLRMWRSAVESQGVLVFQMVGVETSIARGFSIPGDIYPVIAVNPSDALNGRVFTLIHEFVHLALHAGGPCHPTENRIEEFCDRVAGSVLLPKGAVLTSAAGADFSDASIVARWARYFGVSEFAFITRLRLLGEITQKDYQAHAARLRHRRGSVERDSSGGPSYYRVQVSRLGRPFIRLLINAFEREALSQRDLGAHLNVRVTNLEKLFESM